MRLLRPTVFALLAVTLVAGCASSEQAESKSTATTSARAASLDGVTVTGGPARRRPSP